MVTAEYQILFKRISVVLLSTWASSARRKTVWTSIWQQWTQKYGRNGLPGLGLSLFTAQ